MFEGRLARRYIGSQKRHAALTVCSIAIALALIVMLFSVFSTVIDSLRNIAYDQGAYHIRVLFEDKELYDAFEKAVSDYGTCTLEQVDIHWGTQDGVHWETQYYANVMFDENIDSIELFIDRIATQISTQNLNGRVSKNALLMLCDMIDTQSRLYMVAIVALFYVFVLFLIMMLRLIIDTAFEISSKERERQFGVLQSIGATPKQIVRVITYEGLMLSVIGIPLGVGLGIGLGYAAFRAVLSTGLADLYLTPSKAAELVHFYVNPWLLLIGVVTGAAWVMFSAYGTGMRVIKMSPVQAISARSNTVKKVRKTSLFGKLFGWTGKIASRNNMRQPKRFIATVVSLTLSIALFSAVTVVTGNMIDAAEDFYAEFAPPNDFSVNSFEEDPLGYRQHMNLLKESGLFGELLFQQEFDGTWLIPDSVAKEIHHHGGDVSANVEYYNRDAYNNLFDGNPPVSYDELTESGKYIFCGKIAAEIMENGFNYPDNVSIMIYEAYSTTITEEEYNALPPEEQKKYREYTYGDYLSGAEIKFYEFTPTFTVDFGILFAADPANKTSDLFSPYGYYCRLIGTIDQYENGEYKHFSRLTEQIGGASFSIGCVLTSDDSYYKALELIKEHFGDDYFDFSAERLQLRALLSSVNIGAAFFSILIALIAAVNMVNILSTGILNRRGELAAMQCVGMTEKQLCKMTAVECLQYALTSGIAAIFVCVLMMFLTEKMLLIVDNTLEYLGEFASLTQPLPIIGIASLCAFAVAIAASVIPLRAMQKTSLVEQIRSVE